MWFEQMHPGWQIALAGWKPFLQNMESQLGHLENLVPSVGHVMAAFESDPKSIRVVLVGQDPYPGQGLAVGLAFAVANQTKQLPASLRNIFKEIQSDLGVSQVPNPDLAGWRQQGVFLLNRHLTALMGETGAHTRMGWDAFTLAAVQHLVSSSQEPPVLLLWGAHAQKLQGQLQVPPGVKEPTAITAAHPSPLSACRGFFGSKCFSRVNQTLLAQGFEPIDWTR